MTVAQNVHRKDAMSLMSLIVTLIVIGVLLWLLNTYIPMDGKIKSILNAVIVIAVVLWLLSAFGVLGQANAIQLPRVR
jgi:cation transporter-like permease